jgi:lysophospholipase L1-like esterase
MKWKVSVLIFTGISAILLLFYLHRVLWIERLLLHVSAPVFGKVWQAEVQKFRNLYPNDSVRLIFLGDSHMEQCEWHEVLPEWNCANRGIGGETTEGLLSRLDCLPENGNHRTVFLQTGVNDLIAGKSTPEVLERYRKILDRLCSAGYRVVPTLVFPVRYLTGVNERVPFLNEGIRKLAASRSLNLIDLNPLLLDDKKLRAEFSFDGVHLNAAGYSLWLKEIRLRLAEKQVSGSR